MQDWVNRQHTLGIKEDPKGEIPFKQFITAHHFKVNFDKHDRFSVSKPVTCKKPSFFFKK